jgi:DNA repair ATPase RecN
VIQVEKEEVERTVGEIKGTVQQMDKRLNHIETDLTILTQRTDQLRNETHQKIDQLRNETHQKIDQLRNETHQKIDQLRNETHQKIDQLRMEHGKMFRWIIGLILASWISILGAIISFVLMSS